VSFQVIIFIRNNIIKGEALVLVTDKQDADGTEISAYAKKNGISELSAFEKH
jgi:hypothetical protein